MNSAESQKAAGAASVVLLVAERAAFQAEREAMRRAEAEPRERAIFMEGGAVGRVG